MEWWDWRGGLGLQAREPDWEEKKREAGETGTVTPVSLWGGAGKEPSLNGVPPPGGMARVLGGNKD